MKKKLFAFVVVVALGMAGALNPATSAPAVTKGLFCCGSPMPKCIPHCEDAKH